MVSGLRDPSLQTKKLKRNNDNEEIIINNIKYFSLTNIIPVTTKPIEFSVLVKLHKGLRV